MRLEAGHQPHEQLALDRHAFVERQGGGGLDALDVGLGRLEAAEGLGVGLAVGVEHAVLDAQHRLVADAAQRQVLGEHAPGEVDRARAQVVDDRVDQAELRRGLGPDRRAGGDHLERLLGADDARQALRAAGAGQQAELDLGQAELRARHGDAVVGDERDLEPAAQRGAVDRGDDGLGAVLDRRLDVVEGGAARRLAELADVGAGDEGAAGADQDDRLDRIVGDRRGHAAGDAVADVGGERVDRWRIDGQDADVAFDRQVGHGIDRGHRRLSPTSALLQRSNCRYTASR